jgi:hypothetical protein
MGTDQHDFGQAVRPDTSQKLIIWVGSLTKESPGVQDLVSSADSDSGIEFEDLEMDRCTKYLHPGTGFPVMPCDSEILQLRIVRLTKSFVKIAPTEQRRSDQQQRLYMATRV